MNDSIGTRQIRHHHGWVLQLEGKQIDVVRKKREQQADQNAVNGSRSRDPEPSKRQRKDHHGGGMARIPQGSQRGEASAQPSDQARGECREDPQL